MNKDPLFSAKLKLEGAKRHIGDLAGHIKAFFGTEPYPIATSVEAEPEGPQQVLKVKITKPLSNEIYACAGDALHNLRSVLDHLACALAIQNGHSDPGKTEFPIVGGENWLDDPGTKKKIKLISAEANALIRDLKPYKGGDNILWALNRLRVTDTHKTVVPIGSALLGISGQMIMKPSGIGVHTFETPRWCRFNENMEALILRFPKTDDFESNFDINLDVAFCNVEFVDGVPVTMALNAFGLRVNQILSSFEERFFKS